METKRATVPRPRRGPSAGAEGPLLVLAAALLALVVAALLTPAPRPSPPPPVAVASPSVEPSPSPVAAATAAPTPVPPSPSPSAPVPVPSASPPRPAPPPRRPRVVLTPPAPSPSAPEPAAPETAPPEAAEPGPVEVPVTPGVEPGAEEPAVEAQGEGPLQVSARIERWPADGPDPAVRVAVLLRNPEAEPLLVDSAEVEFTDSSGTTLAVDRQAPGRLAAGAEGELWFYYGNAARLYEVRTHLRLAYRAGSQAYTLERRP